MPVFSSANTRLECILGQTNAASCISDQVEYKAHPPGGMPHLFFDGPGRMDPLSLPDRVGDNGQQVVELGTGRL